VDEVKIMAITVPLINIPSYLPRLVPASKSIDAIIDKIGNKTIPKARSDDPPIIAPYAPIKKINAPKKYRIITTLSTTVGRKLDILFALKYYSLYKSMFIQFFRPFFLSRLSRWLIPGV
jgi:hypothetical protein